MPSSWEAGLHPSGCCSSIRVVLHSRMRHSCHLRVTQRFVQHGEHIGCCRYQQLSIKTVQSLVSTRTTDFHAITQGRNLRSATAALCVLPSAIASNQQAHLQSNASGGVWPCGVSSSAACSQFTTWQTDMAIIFHKFALMSFN